MLLEESKSPTPYAAFCLSGCNEGRPMFYTERSYNSQMNNPDATWRCPRCGDGASWDDDNYEAWIDEMEAKNDTN